ncbi:2'-5' RNA ligase family protein [Streptomyces sp. ASQP_92]|uniref:2'-5' RNA ligase family protein n=1 Tax=Streptomyces sp. ASQP_92 TaxID=2979116 RepID=UPI0021C11231|nr:2'-5' RNA ligase family protein [Streptomyces sp. ASQP_92]MCT9092851.1 2'-5' RNA ligase family protein [Streptomyces sp. ASQP_92]
MASPDYSDGCMIALYPPPDIAQQLAVEGGLPADELHVTIAYLGHADDIDGDTLREAVAELAARRPFTAQLAGLARFTGGDKDVLVALVDSPDLEDLRRDTLAVLSERGIEVPREHGFTAHCSLAYLDSDEPAPLDRLDAQPIEFTALSAVHGLDRTDTPLADPMEAVAREAFAAGWALSGGPMTRRVQAACETAVRIATEAVDDPDILKATIDLGKLEGMWALLFQRRQEQQDRHTVSVKALWHDLLTRDAIAAMVDRLRWQLGVSETDGPDEGRIRAAALAAAKAMLAGLADLAGFTTVRIALRNAVAAGRAEGMVNAVAIAAERVGQIGLDWNIAFTDAYAAMERLDELWGDAGGWLGRMVDNVAADLGRALADGMENGLSREDLIDAASDILTGDSDAVAFTVDWAMTTAADEGAFALYQSEGVQMIDIITAGDGRVCGSCIDAESGSPWRMGDQPRMPLHPSCRCCYAADVSLAHFANWFS